VARPVSDLALLAAIHGISRGVGTNA
jgi:hypothetical protein